MCFFFLLLFFFFFNTGVAPFPGATTGTGGRIRDVQSAGRGAHVVAGTAGYSFGNLRIPGLFRFQGHEDSYQALFLSSCVFVFWLSSSSLYILLLESCQITDF